MRERTVIVLGRVCGADLTPVDENHPVEWLRGKCTLTVAVDPCDMSLTIGETVEVVLLATLREGH